MIALGRNIALAMASVLFLCALPQRARADSHQASDVLVGVYALQPEIESFRPLIAEAIDYGFPLEGWRSTFSRRQAPKDRSSLDRPGAREARLR